MNGFKECYELTLVIHMYVYKGALKRFYLYMIRFIKHVTHFVIYTNFYFYVYTILYYLSRSSLLLYHHIEYIN